LALVLPPNSLAALELSRPSVAPSVQRTQGGVFLLEAEVNAPIEKVVLRSATFTVVPNPVSPGELPQGIFGDSFEDLP
jgi:hypothetical protein